VGRAIQVRKYDAQSKKGKKVGTAARCGVRLTDFGFWWQGPPCLVRLGRLIEAHVWWQDKSNRAQMLVVHIPPRGSWPVALAVRIRFC
jgi:hypothetical protein